MTTKRPVVVYGVSGYTGRLVCEYLREYNIPFIAAGRDKARVQAVVEKIPGIETADYEVVEVAHNVMVIVKYAVEQALGLHVVEVNINVQALRVHE